MIAQIAKKGVTKCMRSAAPSFAFLIVIFLCQNEYSRYSQRVLLIGEDMKKVASPRVLWPFTDTERSLIGKWISVDRKDNIEINDNGVIYRNGKITGRATMPCCGNFTFRTLVNTDAQDHKCRYRVIFNKNRKLSFWELKDTRENTQCPKGIFRREPDR